jgi:hypothetical protein
VLPWGLIHFEGLGKAGAFSPKHTCCGSAGQNQGCRACVLKVADLQSICVYCTDKVLHILWAGTAYLEVKSTWVNFELAQEHL